MTAPVETKPQASLGLGSRKPALPWLSWALLAGAGIIALRPLTVTWANNPNYSFGWLMPFVSLFLFIERWPGRPPREADDFRRRLTSPLAAWILLFFLARVATETDPDWRPGLWMVMGLYASALAGWLWIYGGAAWARYFAFPIGFLFLSLPWPLEIERPLVEDLMGWNTLLVAGTLHLFGVTAEAAGNIIRLPNCQLGVEEACSGILSLQSSLMLGCLLGEIYRLAFKHRLLLVLASLAFALIGNYLRTFFLAMIAFFNGPVSVDAWHDTAGFSILIFTAVCVWLTAGAWSSPPVRIAAPAGTDIPTSLPLHRMRIAQRLAWILFLAAMLAETGTQAWFGWNESGVPRHPEWTVAYPKSDSFREIALADATRQALLCDAFKLGQWEDAQGWKWSSYWFQYKPKAFNRSIMGWHNPDNCLPLAGWNEDQVYPGFTVKVNGLDLYVQPRKFTTQATPVYVFWVLYPTSGSLQPWINAPGNETFSAKIRAHLWDIWKGYRGIGFETLEMAVVGPENYEAAQRSYLAKLKEITEPVASDKALANGPGRK